MAYIKASISGICTQTPSVKTFILDCGSQRFDYYPGQWVDLRLNIDEKIHQGGYSITSVPDKNNSIELAIKYASDFPLTTHLHDHSNIGDELYLSNGQGNVALSAPITTPLVLIAGGVGISPLMSMLRYAEAIKTTTPVVLLYSITRPDEFLFGESLQKIQHTLADFQYFITATRANHPAFEFSGRINQAMLASINLPADASYYLCGPPTMVEDVAEMLTNLQTRLSIDPNNIHYDKWW